jgi:hypothetical protein
MGTVFRPEEKTGDGGKKNESQPGRSKILFPTLRITSMCHFHASMSFQTLADRSRSELLTTEMELRISSYSGFSSSSSSEIIRGSSAYRIWGIFPTDPVPLPDAWGTNIHCVPQC